MRAQYGKLVCVIVLVTQSKGHLSFKAAITVGDILVKLGGGKRDYSRQSLAARVLIRAAHIISAQFALESFGYQQPWHDSSRSPR